MLDLVADFPLGPYLMSVCLFIETKYVIHVVTVV